MSERLHKHRRSLSGTVPPAAFQWIRVRRPQQSRSVQSWFSLIFYKLPIPGNILSFSAYPVDGNRASIYEDHPLVESLLSKKCLMRRPDLVIDPYSFDFPDLPE